MMTLLSKYSIFARCSLHARKSKKTSRFFFHIFKKLKILAVKFNKGETVEGIQEGKRQIEKALDPLKKQV